VVVKEEGEAAAKQLQKRLLRKLKRKRLIWVVEWICLEAVMVETIKQQHQQKSNKMRIIFLLPQCVRMNFLVAPFFAIH